MIREKTVIEVYKKLSKKNYEDITSAVYNYLLFTYGDNCHFNKVQVKKIINEHNGQFEIKKTRSNFLPLKGTKSCDIYVGKKEYIIIKRFFDKKEERIIISKDNILEAKKRVNLEYAKIIREIKSNMHELLETPLHRYKSADRKLLGRWKKYFKVYEEALVIKESNYLKTGPKTVQEERLISAFSNNKPQITMNDIFGCGLFSPKMISKINELEDRYHLEVESTETEFFDIQTRIFDNLIQYIYNSNNANKLTKETT